MQKKDLILPDLIISSLILILDGDVCLHEGENWFLYYYGFFRPMYRNYTLPAGKSYKIELIDTWNMTIEELPGEFEGKIQIKMGARQYMAVRMREISD